MIYVGIDVASEKHDICIMSEQGEIFERKFQITNSKDEYEKLLSKIEAAKKLFNDSNVRIGIESTGVYSSTIVNYFASIDGCEVIYINPVLTNMYQLSESVHYAKTDSIDAEGICNYLLDKKSKLLTYTVPSYHIQEIKSLYREMIKINKLITQSRNRLTGIIHTAFPEFLQVFPKIKGKGCFAILKSFPLPNTYKTFKSLLKCGREASQGHFKEEQAKKLIELAKNSIGSYSFSDGIIIKQLCEMIGLLEDQKKEIINRLVILLQNNCQNLLTIPGIGVNVAAGIIGEIGDISNFPNADSVVAFAGCNPMVYESSKYKAKGLKISKRGSPYLRNALIQASRIIVRNDETFITYFNKKRAEGKTYNCSIGHVCKKLIRVIFSILKNNKKFESINNL